MSILNFSQNGFQMIFEITENGMVILKSFSKHETTRTEVIKPHWCNIGDVHVCGENPNDHHFAKHTGSSGCFDLKYVSHHYEEHESGNKLAFLLTNGKMNVTVHYQFYTDIAGVRAWTEVENIGEAPLGLEYVSSFSYTGIDDGIQPLKKMRIFLPHNKWYGEVNWKEYSLRDLGYEKVSRFSGKRIAVSNTGTWSCKEYLPMGAVQNTETQSTILWQIESNGSWHWEISDIDNVLYLKVSGPTEQENAWYRELKKGEVFESVPVALALGKDFDEALEQMTKYRRVIACNRGADAALPVIFNDYMNCLWADPTEEKLLPVIDKAAELGAEYYCMDAGWYADGTWWETVGEWQPVARRFPHGIQYVFDYIRQKGMVPGIWLEPEVMGINCPLASQFEDECFFLRHGKRVIDHGRYQLDFRHPKVREYVMSVFDRVVGEYGVRYIKTDYNIEAGLGTEVNADSFGDGLLGHNRAYLSFLTEVRERYPDLIIESCASGGTRMDYAMLSVAHLQSLSDQSSYQLNSYISAAASTAVLPEQSALWAYPTANATSNGVVVNMVNALLQRIHLSGQVTEISEDKLALIKEAVAVYKSIREDIPKAIPFYPLGIPQYHARWVCSAYRMPDCVRMAIWHIRGEEETVEIPLEGIQSVKILYPVSTNGRVERTETGLRVVLPTPDSALVLEAR